MGVLIFSTAFVWNISRSKKNSATYIHKCTYVFVQSSRYYCPILMKFEFSQQIFKKNPQISNFMKICLLGFELFDADR